MYFDETFEHLNVFVTATRLIDSFKPPCVSLSSPLEFPPTVSANLVVWKLGIDRGRGLIDLTPLVARARLHH